VFIPPARPQHAIERLATGIRVWVHALAPLERPQVDDSCDVALNGADTERLSDRGAIGVRPFFLVPRRLDLATQPPAYS
jgi:hypothetical protein